MNTYKVTLWCGKGYYLNEPVVVDAEDDEEALVKASIADRKCYKVCTDGLLDFMNEELENDERYIYLDRSCYDAYNCYLLIENARIEILKNEK